MPACNLVLIFTFVGGEKEIFLDVFILFHMFECFACTHVHACLMPQRSEEGSGSAGAVTSVSHSVGAGS